MLNKFCWAALKSFKNSAAYEKNFRLRDKNNAPFKLNGQPCTAFGLLKAPELQRLSVTAEVLRVGVISVGVMTVGVLSVGVMTLSHMPNVVSAIDGTSHEKQIPSNEPQQKTYFQQTNYFH